MKKLVILMITASTLVGCDENDDNSPNNTKSDYAVCMQACMASGDYNACKVTCGRADDGGETPEPQVPAFDPEQPCRTIGSESTYETCTDGIDNDCNGYSDKQDRACLPFYCTKTGTEGSLETCTDGTDNDCDGYTDCQDYDCTQNDGSRYFATPEAIAYCNNQSAQDIPSTVHCNYDDDCKNTEICNANKTCQTLPAEAQEYRPVASNICGSCDIVNAYENDQACYLALIDCYLNLDAETRTPLKRLFVDVFDKVGVGFCTNVDISAAIRKFSSLLTCGKVIPDEWIGDACTCEGPDCDIMGIPVPTASEIIGCSNISTYGIEGGKEVCLRTNPASNAAMAPAAYFPEGYCSIAAVGCEGDSVCSTISYGDVDVMTRCPMGSTLITSKYPYNIMGSEVVITSKICARNCETDKDCNIRGGMSCITKGNAKFCYNQKNFDSTTTNYTATPF